MFDTGNIFDIFTNVGDSIGGLFGNIYDTVTDTVSEGANFIGDSLGTLYSDAKEVILGPKDVLQHGIDVAGDVVKTLGSDVNSAIDSSTANLGGAFSSIGSSFSIPLAVAAGIVAIMFINK